MRERKVSESNKSTLLFSFPCKATPIGSLEYQTFWIFMKQVEWQTSRDLSLFWLVGCLWPKCLVLVTCGGWNGRNWSEIGTWRTGKNQNQRKKHDMALLRILDKVEYKWASKSISNTKQMNTTGNKQKSEQGAQIGKKQKQQQAWKHGLFHHGNHNTKGLEDSYPPMKTFWKITRVPVVIVAF